MKISIDLKISGVIEKVNLQVTMKSFFNTWFSFLIRVESFLIGWFLVTMATI